MNKLFVLAALSCLAAGSFASTLTKGTDVRLQFDDNLSSKTAHTGDKVTFHVVDDVLVDGQVAIKKGSVATGKVVQVNKGRRFGVNATLKIQLDPIAASDGTMVPIAARLKGKKTGGGTDKAAMAAGAGALVLGPVGLGIGYFVTGKEVHIKSGDTLTTEVTTDTSLKTLAAPGSVQHAG